jgi:hypothetical protein
VLATAVAKGLLQEHVEITRDTFCVLREVPKVHGRIPHWLGAPLAILAYSATV